jgi:hypothetical protein
LIATLKTALMFIAIAAIRRSADASIVATGVRSTGGHDSSPLCKATGSTVSADLGCLSVKGGAARASGLVDAELGVAR